jgi:hypothetical protein
MQYCKILRGPNLAALQLNVERELSDDWEVQGAPFYASEDRQWCWALVRRVKPGENGEIRLREAPHGIGDFPKRKR